MHTSAMKRANGSTVGARDQVASEKETLAGILGPPPRLPDPTRSWYELVEEAAAAEHLAEVQRARGEPVDDDD